MAIKNANSQAIIAAAQKLNSETKQMDIEHKYGVKMTVKQWVELGIGVTGAVAGTIGAGALVKDGMTAAKEAAKTLKWQEHHNYEYQKLRRSGEIQRRIVYHNDQEHPKIVF